MSVWIDKKYLNLISSRLELFKWTNKDTANHRCPICGDSKKNKFKARGYHYISKGGMSYKCHNCHASMSTGNLIKYVDPQLHKEYVMERFANGENKYSNYQKPTAADFGFTQPEFETVDDRSSLLDSLLSRVDKLPPDHVARRYCTEKRKLPDRMLSDLYFVERTDLLQDLEGGERAKKYAGDEPRLVIPFYSPTGSFLGVTARSLCTDEHGNFIDPDGIKRYLAVRINKQHPMIYNIDRVDRTKTIYVVEGPIDSMYLDNAVATGGTNLKIVQHFLPKERCVLIFDYQPRNPQVVSLVEQAIDLGFNVSLLPEDFPGKDIGTAVESGLSSDEIQKIIDDNTMSGLQAKLWFSGWQKVRG